MNLQWLFRTALAAAAAAMAIAAAPIALSEEIKLRNGAAVQAEPIKENADRLFLDLGFDILSIPKAHIVERKRAASAEADDKGGDARAGEAADAAASGPAAALGKDWRAIAAESATQRRRQTAAQAFAWARAGVVIVSTPSGFGAGFVIDRQGRVLTNQHVVLNEKYIDVTLLVPAEAGRIAREKIKSVEILALSPLMDIALLQLPEADVQRLNPAPLPLAEPGALEEGDPVFAIGNPGMGREILDHTFSEGVVSSLARNFDDVLYVQTTAAVNPGNSGGPLLNEFGEVAGLVSLKAVFQEGIAFALPVDYIRFFLSHEKAFAYGKANPNTGYRYLAPE